MYSFSQDTWVSEFASLCETEISQSALITDDERHPITKFHHIYQALGSEDTLPLRDGFRPSSVPAALPWILIFDVEPGDITTRFRLRLQGSAIRVMMHGDHTGAYLDEITSPQCYAGRKQAFELALAQQKAIGARATLSSASEYRCPLDIGIFPFRVAEACEERQIFLVGVPQDCRHRRMVVDAS